MHCRENDLGSLVEQFNPTDAKSLALRDTIEWLEFNKLRNITCIEASAWRQLLGEQSLHAMHWTNNPYLLTPR
jgi:hypothetical protein